MDVVLGGPQALYHLKVLLRCAELADLQNAAQLLVQVARLAVQGELPVHDPAQIQEIVDQPDSSSTLRRIICKSSRTPAGRPSS